jgi:hypothetical protein
MSGFQVAGVGQLTRLMARNFLPRKSNLTKWLDESAAAVTE